MSITPAPLPTVTTGPAPLPFSPELAEGVPPRSVTDDERCTTPLQIPLIVTVPPEAAAVWTSEAVAEPYGAQFTVPAAAAVPAVSSTLRQASSATGPSRRESLIA